MAKTRFTAEEVEAFVARFAKVPGWRRWIRRTTADGRDLIEVEVNRRGWARLRMTKTDDGRVAATGFDGWSLTVTDSLTELLDAVAGGMPPDRAAASDLDENRPGIRQHHAASPRRTEHPRPALMVAPVH